MPRTASLLCFVALLLSSSGYAQRPRPRTIRGVVTSYSGAPVKNVRVTIVGHNATVTTKADGSYEYCCLRDSVVTMHVIAGGPHEVMVCASAAVVGHLDIPMRGLDIVTNGDPECILYGDVRDRDGRPIADAAIRMIGTRVGDLSKTRNGGFVIRHVPLEMRAVEMSAPGYDKLTLEITPDYFGWQQVLFVPSKKKA